MASTVCAWPFALAFVPWGRVELAGDVGCSGCTCVVVAGGSEPQWPRTGGLVVRSPRATGYPSHQLVPLGLEGGGSRCHELETLPWGLCIDRGMLDGGGALRIGDVASTNERESGCR
jgi:hypothetical protein